MIEWDQNPNGGAGGLAGIVDQLLGEPYAKANHFAKLSLGQIEDLLLEPGASPDASVQRTVGFFCRLLLELDKEGYRPTWNETLADLRDRNTSTHLLPPSAPAEDVPMTETALELESLSKELLPDIDESHMQPDTSSDASDGLPEVDVNSFEEPMMADLPTVPPPIPPHAPSFAPSSDSLILDGSSDDEVTLTGAEEWNPIAHVGSADYPQTDLPVTPPLPPPPPFDDHSDEPTEPGLENTATGELILEEKKAERSLTEDYLTLAEYVDREVVAGRFPLPGTHAHRLAGHLLSSAVEAQCLTKVFPAMNRFWATRESAVQELLDQDKDKFSLHATIKSAMNSLGEKHSDWLLDRKIPSPAIANSLSYLVTASELTKYKPHLLDFGTLLLFFGQEATLGGYPLRNRLGLSGLASEEVMELAFRLFRIHKLRLRASSVSEPYPHEVAELLKADTTRALALLTRLGGESTSDVLQVA